MRTLLIVCLIICGSVCCADEWVPYIPQPIVVPQPLYQTPTPQYPAYPVAVVVPVMVPYVPVVTYQSVLVEHRQWCLFKRYETVTIPRITYLPARY